MARANAQRRPASTRPRASAPASRFRGVYEQRPLRPLHRGDRPRRWARRGSSSACRCSSSSGSSTTRSRRAELQFDSSARSASPLLTLILSLQASYAAPAHPARAEPAGRPRPRADRAGPAARRAQPRRHRVPRPRGGRAAARDEGRRDEGLHPRRAARRCSRSSTRTRSATRSPMSSETRTMRRQRGPARPRARASTPRSAGRSPSSTWSATSRVDGRRRRASTSS